MTYQKIKEQLKEQDLEEEFCSLFEVFTSDNLLNKIKLSDKIHSVASLIRSLISYLPLNSDLYNYWVVVLQYFMHPIFSRPNHISEWHKP